MSKTLSKASRMTKQRAIILKALRSVTSHPTADEIYALVRKSMPGISLGTVYRNLEFLAGCGEIARLDRAGAQKHFDGNPLPHAHVRCRECGSIGDIMSEVALPSCEDIIAPGFQVQSAEVAFTGICGACLQIST